MSTETWRVVVSVPPAAAEEVRARLLDLAPLGFEERETAGGLELLAYADAEGMDRLRAAFPGAAVEAVAPGWEDAWRAFHRPAEAGGVWIGPPWIEPPPGAVAVVIEPGRAFGTGAHPTTRLCVEALAGLPQGSLLDVGCGSGVLSVAGAKLGFGPVLAVDLDPAAIDAARANAEANGVAIDVRQLDALDDPLPAADVVVANIELRAVESLLARVSAAVAVTSGYFWHDAPEAPGWAVTQRFELDGWAADLLRPVG